MQSKKHGIVGETRCAMKFAAMALVLGIAGVAEGQAAPAGMEHHEQKVKVASTSLTIHVAGKTSTLSLGDLQAMPQRTMVVHNGHSNVDESYTGVGLSDLLARYGFTLENGGAKKVYHSYVRAEGTDHYFVLYSASELEPGLHTADAIVALTVNGKPLTEDGQFKFVAGAEKKPARWVTNLSSLTIVTVE